MRWSKPKYYAKHHEDNQSGKDDYRKQEFIDFHQEASTWYMASGSAAIPSGLPKGIL
jgi:hypothetical protein